MLITCASCTTQFQLDDDRVPFEGIRVRCSICKHAFFVPHPDALETDDPVEQHAQEALAAADDATPGVAHDLDAGGPEADRSGESWEFEEPVASPAAGAAPRSFEEGFAAARFAVDDLLGVTPAPAAGPVAAPAIALAEDEPEVWTEPDAAAAAAPEPAWEDAVPWDPGDAPEPPTLDEPEALRGAGAPGAEPVAFDDEPALEAAPPPAADAALGLEGEPAFAAPGPALETFAAPEAEGDLRDEPHAEALDAPLPGLADEEGEESLEVADVYLEAPALETDGWDDDPEPAPPPAARNLPRAQPATPAATDTSLGLGAPLPLAAERRGAPLWLARAGHAAGWVAVVWLAGVALVATLAPARGTGQALAAQAVAGLEASGVAGRFVDSAVAGSVYVIRGELRNPGSEARAPGAGLVVRLLDGAGRPLREAAARVAPPLDERWLVEASPEALRAEAEAGAARLAATPIAPGTSVPFEAVVLGLPDEARRFELAAQPPEAAAEGS